MFSHVLTNHNAVLACIYFLSLYWHFEKAIQQEPVIWSCDALVASLKASCLINSRVVVYLGRLNANLTSYDCPAICIVNQIQREVSFHPHIHYHSSTVAASVLVICAVNRGEILVALFRGSKMLCLPARRGYKWSQWRVKHSHVLK